MKERPILFSGAMVRAILDGSKTQTRRVIKRPSQTLIEFDGENHYFQNQYGDHPLLITACPYGQVGDRLWVRETWGVVSFDFDHLGDLVDWEPDREAKPINELKFGNGYYTGHAIYRADGEFNWCDDYQNEISAWKPSIHMPRFISRITLEIVNIRVERLKDISVMDAIDEGCTSAFEKGEMRGARCEFNDLWESINGAGSWALNPWVWVIEFMRV